MPKRKATPKPKAADTRPVNQRGQEWQAQKLTGNRAQKGNLPSGAPRWTYTTYEVQWAGTDPKTKKPSRVSGLNNVNNNKESITLNNVKRHKKTLC